MIEKIYDGGMRIRRRDKRVWFVGLGVFVAVFLFTFLGGYFEAEKKDAEAASLADFDPGYIISDYQMGNYNAMSESEIQTFLTMKNSCSNRDESLYNRMVTLYPSYSWHFENGHFVCLSEELFGDGEVIGSGETAAHIIWQAAQDYKINPQVLIVLLQKEQGLITDTYPNNRQYRSATGYGCPDTAPCAEQYYGFKNQVRKAAALFRTVLDGGWTNYPLGENYIQYNPSASCGGSVVNIRSLATSALYRYTPYQPNAGALAAGYGTAYCGAYGNRNFYLYFEDWFGGITSSVSNVNIANGIYQVKSGLNENYGLAANGEWLKNSSEFSKWYIEKTGDAYTIQEMTSGLYLAAEGSGLKLAERTGGVKEEWIIDKTADGKYTFYSRENNLVVDVSGALAIDNTTVGLYRQWGENNLAQKWIIDDADIEPVEIEDGVYEIVSGLVRTYELTVNGQRLANSNKKMRWYVERQPDGYYTIKEVLSGSYLLHGENGLYVSGDADENSRLWLIARTAGEGYVLYVPGSKKVIDVSGASMKNNAEVWLYPQWGRDNKAQKWGFEKVEMEDFTTITTGIYNIISTQNNSYGLTAKGGSLANSSINTRFTIEKANEYYTVKDLVTGLYLTANGYQLVLEEENNKLNQEWIFVEVASEEYTIYSAYSFIVVDISGALPYNNTPVNLYPQWGENNLAQKWKLKNANIESAIVDDGVYEIRSTMVSGYGLSRSGDGVANSNAREKWKIEKSGDDYLIADIVSGKYLTADDMKLALKEKENNDCQKWVIGAVGNQSYTIYSKCNYYTIDISGALPYNNTPVNLYPQWGENNLAQKWKLKKFEIAHVELDDGAYEIISTMNQNYGLAIRNDGVINSSALGSWVLERTDGAYRIMEVDSGKYLTADGFELRLGDDGGSCQEWFVDNIGGEQYTIYSKCNYYTIDISGALPYNNTPVNLYPQWGENNLAQKWKLRKI